MNIIRTQFKGFKADNDVFEDLDCHLNWDVLEANLDKLSDLQLSRFGLYLNHTEEETGAFLLALGNDPEMLSDMTLIYDSYLHSGISEDPEEYDDLGVGPIDICFNVMSERDGMKSYMESQGVNYTNLDLLSQEDRAQATKWLELRREAQEIPGTLSPRSSRKSFNDTIWDCTVWEFTDPEFLKLAMSDPRVMELAKQHETSDAGRLKDMLSHEASLTAGVL